MNVTQAYQMISEKLSTWLRELIKLLPNIVLAAVILTLGFFISKWIKKAASKLFTKILNNPTLVSLFTSMVYVFLLAVTLFIALSVVNLSKVVTTALAGAGIIGLALAFAFQDIASNFMSGIFISIRKPINVNDIIKIKNYMGTVIEVNLRDTVVKTFQGQMVIIPNKDIMQNPIENYTLLGKRRMDLNVRVSYGEDLEKVKNITLKAVESIQGLTDDKTDMYFMEFGENAIEFVIRLWVATSQQGEYLQVKNDAVMQIKKAYEENGILIPFPVTTLDFGIKRGVSLEEMALELNNKPGDKIKSPKENEGTAMMYQENKNQS